MILLLLSYGGFSLWHNWVIDHTAFGTNMLDFKPTEEDSYTLQELMAINPDVRGWITIDGTHIDYPVVQGKYDYEYLNKDVFGEYVLSGSIFMSTTNAPDFSDPYTLVYGHHMDNGAMFGDIDLFQKPDYPAFSTNYVVDAIAAYYQEEADKKGIRIDWNIFVIPQLPVDETELCVVIGNLLENAIKASERVEPSRKVIEASIRMVGEKMIGIEIRNHYKGRIHLSREGMPAPRDREGIGLYSVSNTVRKNNGTFSVEVDDEWFCVDIIINMPSE